MSCPHAERRRLVFSVNHVSAANTHANKKYSGFLVSYAPSTPEIIYSAPFSLDKPFRENRFPIMKILTVLLATIVLAAIQTGAQTNPPPAFNTNTPTVETIVCIRHGEKLNSGL